MKLTRKSLMLLFFLFSLAYIQCDQYKVLSDGGLEFDVNGNETTQIRLSDQYHPQEYIGIKLTKEKPLNPYIYIAKDIDCKSRFFVGVQMIDTIYSFVKTEDIRNNENIFYICTKERQKSDLSSYTISISDKDSVRIPLNAQASYYVYGDNIRSMEFIFYPENVVDKKQAVTFWAKGKNITAGMSASSSQQIENGYYFYDPAISDESVLNVVANVGDYITIGSTLVTQEQNAKELKVNAAEMVVASYNDVCFPINATKQDLSFITGKIYTKRAKTYFTDQMGKILYLNGESTERDINDGIINDINIIHLADGNHEKGKYCVGKQKGNTQLMIFSVQMRMEQKDPAQVNLPPLLPGEIQHHTLLNGQMAIFYGSKPNDDAKEVNFNIKAYKGFPQTYSLNCTSFPYCHYTQDSLNDKNYIYPSNMVTAYSYYFKAIDEKDREFNPISSFQPLVIVYCGKGGKVEDFFGEDSFCEFETTYFTDKDSIKLYEGCSFSQFLSEFEEDKYTINLKNENIDLIYLDLLLFSGDADIVLPNRFAGENANKYYLSNKIFYSIRINIEKPDSFEFYINAIEPTFYLVEYKLLNSKETTEDINTLDSGINYITSKAFYGAFNKIPKHLEFLNFKYEFNQPYLVSLYSPNCIFDVDIDKNGVRDTIAENTNEMQQIIISRYDYYGEKFNFYYTIKEDENTAFSNRICMVYAAGLELSNSTEEWNERSISLSEGVPHRYMFNRFHPFIAYSYHVSDTTKKLVIFFNLIDKDYFDILININGVYIKKESIYRNSQIFVTSEEFEGKCVSFEVCTVDVRIQMKGLGRARTVETTIYQLDKIPFYLEKNVIKQDILIGNIPKHYYFDIGESDYGDITLDFKRGSGNIFATVKERNLNEPMENSDWRKKYHFPEFIHDSLPYDTYGKKILITEESTKNCTGGCYVLITILSNIRYKGELVDDEETPFRISINPRIVRKDTNYPIPKVKIGVNDFIIGNIMYGLPENRKYDYYSVILPFESEQILIDWQANSPSLIINVGDTRPTKYDADFIFPPIGKDIVQVINRSEILEKGGFKNNTFIRNLELTIGVYADVSDSITSSPYAFKILMPPSMQHSRPSPPPHRPSDRPSDDQSSDRPRPPMPIPLGPVMHMIHIRSDQKIQCLPFIYENTYTCLFAVIVDDSDVNNNITIYARSQNGNQVTIYGKDVDAEDIERNNNTKIMKYIEEVFKNSNLKQPHSYVNIKNAQKSKSFFFMTTLDYSGDIIEILSSSFRYRKDMSLYPNPSTAQVFSMNYTEVNFKFSSTKNLLINIACITGNGNFYWENNENKKFYLDGPNDRLSLTTYTDIVDDKLSSLKINPGKDFIFVVTYYPRTDVDQLNKNQNTEIYYRSVNMPLNYYLPITIANDWTINFNFYEIGLKDNSNLIYDTSLFTIWAKIISEETAQSVRYNPQSRPTCDNYCVKGIYDSTFGHLYLDKDFIEDAKKQQNIDAPYLFISVDTDVRTDFSTMDMEINIFSDFKIEVQKDIFVSGKLSNSKEKKYAYYLDTEGGEKTLYVQYAANSDSVKFVLNTDTESEENIKNYDVKTVPMNGYNQMSVTLDKNVPFIFLIIYYKDNLNEQLTHFIFRYSFKPFENKYTPYNNKITLTGEDNNYKISFYQISDNKVTSYYIKAYYKDGLIDGEKIDTIAMSESPGAYMQINDASSNNDLSYNLITDKRVKYIKVMAITTDEDKKYYYLYNTLSVNRPLESRNLQQNGQLSLSGSGNKTFIIQLNDDKNSYGDYIGIYLQGEQTKNPMIYVGKDEDCTNRLFAGVQMYDNIYGFFKKEQIDKEFYICIKERQNTKSSIHLINIENRPLLTLPYNAIASNYISEKSMETIKSNFGSSENIASSSDITFWVTGKNIVKADLGSFEKKQIDNGYIFYGTYRQGAEITVETKVGDYITVGSTVVTNRKTTEYLTENTRERMIASKGEVCLPIKITEGLSFITGKIYTKRAKTYFKDRGGSKITINGKTYESTINNGIISDMNILRIRENEEEGYYCIDNEDNELMIFSVQLTKSEDEFGDIFLSPMLPGEIKRHYLLKGQMAIFYGMKPNKDAIEVNFNIKALAGFPEMYYDECKTFPYCHYTKGLLKKLTHPYPSNMVTTYSYYKGETDDYTPISTFQPLMIVNCEDANKDMLFDQGFYCEFETTYFTDQDTIKLYQDTSFSQFLYYDEEDKYLINLENENIDLIYLDLLLFSGDADIVLPDFKGTAHKYYLSNKIFYSIHLDSNKPNSLEFRINATEKTFYTVQYKLLKSSQSDDMNTIESGINYITSKYYDASVTQTEKHLQFLNLKYEYYQPYLVTFYSPNCLFDVYWLKNKTTNEIEQINNDSYQAQRIINPLDEDYHYYSDKFEFYYKIKEDDSSQYPKKFCMIYATGIEITNFTQQWNGRSISLSEGVPHRYRFNEEHPYIVYSYHVSDPTKNLILNFNLLDKEYFDVNVDINKRKDVIFSTVYRNGQITITDEELKGYCVEFEVCTVDVKISMRNSKMGRMLEFTMYQLDKNPFYLEKNVVKQDILNGNMPKYYYFDISNKEYGDITLDFKRGSGKMYASIQSRTLDKPMADPEWRGKYHFPQTIDESLKYDVYGKKIIIAAENTTKCEDGCYVLITIFSSVRYYGIMDEKVTPFRISINPRIMQNYDFVLSPRVKINVNDYIVGSIMYGATGNRKYDYYSFVIPYESEQLMIDWQADSPSLFINVGETRPTEESKHFTPTVLHKDFVYIINRNEITAKAEKEIGWSDNDHMRNMELTIGVYSDDIDSITSSPYTFKIFMPGTLENPSSTAPEDSNLMAAAMHIIHIRSDQKVQCFPFSYNGTYSCIFAVIVDDMDIRSNIVVYPKAQDGSPVTIYGKIVNSEEVERNNGPRLMAHIRDIFKNDEYKRHDQFIYYKNVEKTEAFLFIVTQEGTQEIVEVLSSSFFIKYDNVSYTPNPSTPQIYAIGDHSINFNFWTTRDYLVNIACVSGRGKFYWQDHPDVKYYLGGFGDRISLTTYTNIEENKLSLLKVESDTDEETDFLQGGFIFYITYYPRSNVDQLKTGQSTEINYRNVNMPLNYFAPITMADDWIINFNFYDISLKNKANLQYDTNLFTFWSTIVSDEKAQEIRKDSNKKPNYDSNSIKGIYDSSLGCLFLDKETAATMFDDKQTTGVPTLFFSIEKNSGVGADFSTLGLEVNVYSRSPNEEISEVPERIFISGKLSYSNKNRLVYHLKLDRNKLYITIQCSANSNLLKFELSTNPDRKEDVPGHSVTKDIIGIQLISVELDENNFPKNGVYLIVSTDEKNITKPLDYFTFGYFLSSYKENIGSILEGDDLKLKVDRNRQNYKISFKPIPFDGVSYYIKAYYKSGFIEGEKIETIAISESPGQYLVVNAPAHEILKEISCDLTTRKAVNYIKVIAKLNLQEYKLYNVYEPKFVNTEDVTGDEEENKNKNEESNKTLIYVCIGIGSVLLVVAIVLFVFFFLYKNRNRNLLEQVNKISFAESGAQEKEKEDSSNLLINEDEETLT